MVDGFYEITINKTVCNIPEKYDKLMQYIHWY